MFEAAPRLFLVELKLVEDSVGAVVRAGASVGKLVKDSVGTDIGIAVGPAPIFDNGNFAEVYRQGTL
jgi:hypothetical protein